MELSIGTVCLGKEKAQKYIHAICKDMGFPIPSNSTLKENVVYNIGDKQQNVDFPKEIAHLRKLGKAQSLQFLYDSKDVFLKIPIELGIYNVPSGLKIDLSNTYGKSAKSFKAPGSFEAPETSLSSDIIYYRKHAVESFNNDLYEEFNRAYRAYLFASISLVDCFLHRYNFYIKENIQNHTSFENLKELDSISSIENRLIAWMVTFSIDKMDEIKSSKEWSKFMELKKARNQIIHPVEPALPYSVKDIVKLMNLAKDGIGGLLLKMRKSANQREFIGFIQCIKNLPEIRIIKE